MDLATAKGNGPTEFGPNENIGAVGTQGCKQASFLSISQQV